MYWKAGNKGEEGYAVVDLLATVAVVFVLALVTFPLLAANRSEADAAVCLASKRQLMRAWQGFAEDNNQTLPGVYHGGDTILSSPAKYWAQGWLDWSTGSANTNTLFLTSGSYAQLAPYAGSNRFIFKCPADVYTSSSQKRMNWRGRVRSVSANLYVGDGNVETGPFNPLYAHVKKTSDFRTPGPADVYVYLDEHPDSLNDPGFFSPNGVAGALTMVDVPAAYHHGGAGLSFADGRAEVHRWVSPLRITKVTTAGLITPPNGQLQADLRYLYEHTPRR